MSEKKKAHYVSKFYLKRFSNNGISIGIYNLPSHKYIKEGSLRNQAYENYFYGKKGHQIENALGALEGRVSILISEIVKNNAQLLMGSPEYQAVLSFVIILRFRTLYAADEQNEMLDKMIKKVFAHDTRVAPHLKAFEAKFKDPGIAALSQVGITLPLAFDLGTRILTNNSGFPLITSDNPAIFYNQLLEKKKIMTFSGTGIASKGLQIFFPLDPKHLLLFYDRDVYKIGSARKETADYSSIKDTRCLNRLQILNCGENIYFEPSTQEDYIRSLAASCEPHRSKSKARVEEYLQGKGEDGKYHSIIHVSKKDIKANLELSFVRILKKARHYDFGDSVFHVRNPYIVRLHDDFMELVEAGKYAPADFNKYLFDMQAIL